LAVSKKTTVRAVFCAILIKNYWIRMANIKTVGIGHGAGGQLSNQLIRKTVLRHFSSPILRRLEDSAEIALNRINYAFTTDSYVIDPIFFPGGDIGKLAVCGTINDLVAKAARPLYLSFSMIIEAGFPIKQLDRILLSAARSARKARVEIVAGDTKVVNKGKADKIFITTTGIGKIMFPVSAERISAGDKIIVSGMIADHGVAVVNARLNLGLKTAIKSDVQSLDFAIDLLKPYAGGIKFMRDPTRGGVASVLNEAIEKSGSGMIIDERALPIRKQTRAVCDILGLDPLYVANEGKMIIIVNKRHAARVLAALRRHPSGRDARVIGDVVKKPAGVWLKTNIGSIRPLLLLQSEGLPRIC
jgi:hydrogenase expression/formation protein HypE